MFKGGGGGGAISVLSDETVHGSMLINEIGISFTGSRPTVIWC